jgi:hypothetical protein
MRRVAPFPLSILPAAVIACALPPVSVTTAWAADCRGEVAAAFERQRTAPAYRAVSRQPSPRGEIVNTIDYRAPDRMHNRVEAPGEPAPLETIAIGRWAWANQGGGWQELQPQFAQSITAHVATALREPVTLTEPFDCLGRVTHAGRSWLAYRTTPRPADAARAGGPDNPLLARTILIDPATGLPGYNLIVDAGLGGGAGTAAADGAPLMAVAYSYPADITIEAPDAVPAGSPR